MRVSHDDRGSRFLAIFSLLLLQNVSLCRGIDARVKLHVDGEGSHRNFVYSVSLDKFLEDCHVAIYLKLPAGLYVNIDELAELRRQEITTACSIGETDVELFMENAKTQNVTVCASLESAECVLKFPIHQRYQYAREHGGYGNIIVPKPKVLLGCRKRIKEHRVSKIDLCSPCVDIVPKWREVFVIMEEEDYVWLVPVGNSSLLTIVTCITLLTTILGAMFISKTIWKSTAEEHQKNN